MPRDDVTHILSAIDRGDPQAAERLLPLVYEELRELAGRRLIRECPGGTLQATALVHEAYLRLIGAGGARQWDSRGHFFAAAAEAMRRILVDDARRRRRHKHGGGRRRVELAEVPEEAPACDEELVALDEALGRLAEADPTSAEVVKLRYFAGLSIDQVAEALGLSPRTADRRWAYARAWLHRELRGD